MGPLKCEWHMEIYHENKPLLLRLSDHPATMLKRKSRESENKSSESWTNSEEEISRDSKRLRLSSTSSISGQELATRIGERHSTPSSPKSTPALLQRLGEPTLKGPNRPRLLSRLTSPNPVISEAEMKSKRSLRNFLREESQMRMMTSIAPLKPVNDMPTKKICHGTIHKASSSVTRVAPRLVEHSPSLVTTSMGSKPFFESPITSPREYQLPNGTESSKGNLSTLTKCSPQCIAFSLMRRERVALETLKSYSLLPNQSGKLRREPTGQQLSGRFHEQSPFSFPTARTSFPNTRNISRDFSLPNKSPPTPVSSCTTKPSETKSVEVKTSSLLMATVSPPLEKPSLGPTEWSMVTEEAPVAPVERVEAKGNREEWVRGQALVEGRTKSARTSTVPMDASSPKTNASTSTPAKAAETVDMGKRTATKVINAPEHGMQPKYLRYNVWDPTSDFTPTTADWTEMATPLSRPPLSELVNPIATKTIREYPDLFKVITPIKVDIFESYLSTHPNQPFVRSICEGLREGFWPWADTTKPDYPAINDQAQSTPADKGKAQFLKDQLEVELTKGRFSPSFGTDLLPGMYSMPIYAVPKPNSSDFRLVTDQSYGKHSLNSMVKHESVTGYPLDNLVHFGEMLLDLQRKKPDQVRVAWKSDIAEAYRILPMHPLWQIKQINMIEGKRYVDRCNAFGGSASGALFIAVNSLVAWIAKRIKGVSYLGNYVDDSSGCGLADDTVFYEPYQRSFPRDQVILLSLWDELGIPHKEKKQVYGSPLTVIGINVDANNLSFTLPDEAKVRLMEELKWWCRSGGKERLRRWFQMGGWFNWALNAYPLLRPALNNFYPKLKGRRDSPALIWVNKSIRDDFAWAMRILENSTGVLLLKSLSWGLEDATLLIYCDACPAGMGFWYPKMRIGFYSPTPPIRIRS